VALQSHTFVITLLTNGQYRRFQERAILISRQQYKTRNKKERKTKMNDLLIAAAFLAMVLAPCIVAMFSGKDAEAEA